MSENESKINIQWFKDILIAFNESDYKINKFNECYDIKKKYLELEYNDNKINIENWDNIEKILKDIVNDDDVYNELISTKYDNIHLFLPLFIKKIFKKDSIIIDYNTTLKKYYFNVPYNNELNLNNYYSFLKNKLIKLYKSNYLIINIINNNDNDNYNYNNELNFIGNCGDYSSTISKLFEDFFFIKNNDGNCEIKLNPNIFNYNNNTYKINNIVIEAYEHITDITDSYNKKLISFKEKYKNYETFQFQNLENMNDNFLNYKKSIIIELISDQENKFDKIKKELLIIYNNNNEIEKLSYNRLLEIYSNHINANNNRREIVINDGGNNCIQSFLFAIFNRKNKYIEKYILNANINSNIKDVSIIKLAKEIQKELKIIYNILSDHNYKNTKKIDLIDSFNSLNQLNKFPNYKTDLKELINLLYYLYDIEDINYDKNKNKIKIFDIENDDSVKNIKNAKILLYKNNKLTYDNNLVIYENYDNNNIKFPPNNSYNLYINTIIFYINEKYYNIYNKNNEYFYKNQDINLFIKKNLSQDKGYVIYINIDLFTQIFKIEDINIDINYIKTNQDMNYYVYYSYL